MKYGMILIMVLLVVVAGCTGNGAPKSQQQVQAVPAAQNTPEAQTQVIDQDIAEIGTGISDVDLTGLDALDKDLDFEI